MKRYMWISLLVVCGLLLGLAGSVGAQTPLGTAFTYQGRLSQGGTPVTDTCDFQFSLYDAASGGSQVGATQTVTGVRVEDGLFTVELDFGTGVFQGDARWLAVAVRCPGSGSYTTLTPRQALTAAPYALYAPVAGSVVGGGGGDITAVLPGPGLIGGGESDDVILSVDFGGMGSATTVAHSDHSHDASYWSLTGNGGTSPGTNFLGTTDNVTMTVAVSNTVALRLEPTTGTPNLIGGYGGNRVTSDAVGAAIGGGGAPGGGEVAPIPNRVSDDYGTVGGGAGNQAGDNAGTTTDASYATVGGGQFNTARGEATTVAGGSGNTASGRFATVPGGRLSAAAGDYSFAAGRWAQANHQGAFVWADSTDAPFASTAQDQFAVWANGGVVFTTGGAPFQINGGEVWTSANYGPRPTAPMPNTLTTLDSAGDVGYDTSITIGADGLGLISYYDSTNGDLKVAHCNDLACTSTTITTLDSAGDVGNYTSITIGADGLGLISYYDNTNGDLKVAHCNDVACTSATLTTLDSTGLVGWYTSVTIGADGLGLISYYDYTNRDLKVAHCNDVACTGATLTTLDSIGDVGAYTSITIGADGLGLISYYDDTNGDLKVAHCYDVACTIIGTTLATLDSAGNVGAYTSITIGADGLGLISYYDWTNENLKVAHCGHVACIAPSATITTLDSTGTVGVYTSITISPDGLGLISYYDWTNEDLKVAHCHDVACTGAAITTLDSTGNVGMWNSITIGADGLGLIGYYDWTNEDLKVAHCANTFCVPYFRRR